MKQKFLSICAAAFLFVACSNEKTEGETTAKDSSDTKMEKMDDGSKKEQAWIPIDSAAAMQAMMAAGTTGEEHKMLAKSNGTWAADMTYWDGIDRPANKMSGTQVNRMILDGHFQQSTFSGSFMGMPFNGVSTVGYDNTTKEFVSTWMENMNTSIMVMKGTWDASTKTINLTGKQKNPVNGIECTMRQVYKMVDDNNEVMEMYGPDPKTGKEFKMIEIKYTRKK
ncbi:MAG TPA: DUF1579 domain-containing protein [Chitinophagaceae bacterium]|nr:DUF1579 domain-containing protein [Chitinophagaceae bacterium]